MNVDCKFVTLNESFYLHGKADSYKIGQKTEYSLFDMFIIKIDLVKFTRGLHDSGRGILSCQNNHEHKKHDMRHGTK